MSFDPERIKEIFARAFELKTAGERERFLTEACHDEPMLREEVESLLRAYAQAGALQVIDPAKRQAFLDRACAGNQELREEVNSLLQAHKPADDFLGNEVTSPDTHSRGSMLWWVGIVLMLYVLSIGPVVRLALEEKIPLKAPETIYAPLVWLCETPVGKKFVRPSLIWYGNTIWRWELPVTPVK